MIKLSIIIPAYNVGSLIENCIISCQNQDMSKSEYEIIIVDDGSKDDTYKYSSEITKKYNNVTVYTQPNQGQSGARNNGLDKARGEYVWFVDADDYIIPNCLNELYNKAKEHQLDALYFLLQRHYEGQQNPSKTYDCRQKTLPTNEVLNGIDAVINGYYPCSSCAAIYRLEKLNKENLRFLPKIFRQDVEFTLRSIPTFNRIMFLPDAYYIYYTHEGTVTTSKEKNIIIRKMTGDGYVANTCKQLAEKYKYNIKLSRIFYERYHSVMLGALLYIWNNRKDFNSRGISMEILDNYEQLGVYPVKAPYKNLKHRIIYTLILNHKIFL